MRVNLAVIHCTPETTGPLHTPSVIWFKRDLRTTDHRPLWHACNLSRCEQRPVLGVYWIQPEIWLAADADARHWEFVRSSLAELRKACARLGIPLLIRQGAAVGLFARLHKQTHFSQLLSHEETGNLASFAVDRAVAKWCREQQISWSEFPQNGVNRRLRSRSGWAARWEARMAEPLTQAPDPLPPSTTKFLPPLGEFEAAASSLPTATELRIPGIPGGPFQYGGRTSALDTLQSFLRSRATGYRKNISSPLTAASGCSRLSTHLAWGTVSLREIVHSTRSVLAVVPPDPQSPPSRDLTSFLSRLHWRCHFMQKLEDAPHLETQNLWRAADALRSPEPDEELLRAWTLGRTGYPFLDACLRAVQATGWMNFRMRAMMVSFSSYDLWQHWREPGLHLARCFTDYEPGIHYPQVQMQSGTTGINTLRMYDPVKQGLDHDPHGTFIRRWVPELRRIPGPWIHQPWALSPLELADCQLRPGIDYPLRIVEHRAAISSARAAFSALRAQPDAREEADRIQERHGSRKSGLPTTSRKKSHGRRKTTARAQSTSQLRLFGDDLF